MAISVSHEGLFEEGSVFVMFVMNDQMSSKGQKMSEWERDGKTNPQQIQKALTVKINHKKVWGYGRENIYENTHINYCKYNWIKFYCCKRSLKI